MPCKVLLTIAQIQKFPSHIRVARRRLMFLLNYVIKSHSLVVLYIKKLQHNNKLVRELLLNCYYKMEIKKKMLTKFYHTLYNFVLLKIISSIPKIKKKLKSNHIGISQIKTIQ